ncbi:MAG: serine/threonine-protein kinase [Planctomycetota bacterium]
MSSDPQNRDPLEELMDEFSARCRAGENPSVSEYVQRLPEQEDEIRDMFPTVALMEQMKKRADSSVASHPVVSTEDIPKQLGNYQILREIGRGGMGVVFQAVQEGLERKVALKVMNANAITSEMQLKRFRREVRSAAGLHHTNIVPVFAVGEDNGTHYYSMQFIDGVSLDEYIGAVRSNSTDAGFGASRTLARTRQLTEAELAETRAFELPEKVETAGGESNDGESGEFTLEHGKEPLANSNADVYSGSRYWRRVATIGYQISDALQWAHDHGVLHRDIKPQNLLLDRIGNVWVTDFGLAKLEDDQVDASQTGNIVGTLMYMSPEQLQGKASAASDVYSLGLTLYELLALKAAFGKEGQTTTIAERLKPKEVTPLRTINPSIPRDLETIVMKAIRHDSADRYSSAQQMRDDLEAFLEGRAISARRATPVEKLWKWARRNPALAASLSLLLLVLTMFAVIAQAGRMRIEQALEDTRESKKLADTRLDLATDGYDAILDTYTEQSVETDDVFDIREETTIDAPVTIADTRRLALLLEHYEQFALQGENDPELNLKIARAKSSLGDIQMKLGSLDQAEAAYEDVVGWVEGKGHDGETDLMLIRAQSFNELGKVSLQRGNIPESLARHVEARATLMEMPDNVRRDPDVRFELARTSNLISSMFARSRIAFQRRDLELDLSPANGGPGSAGQQRSRGPQVLNRIREGVERRIRAQGFGIVFEELTERHRKYVPVIKEESEFRRWLIDVSAEARDQLADLWADFPGNEKYRLDYARALRYFAVLSEGEAGRESFRESVSVLSGMVTDSEYRPIYSYELADCLTESGKFNEPEVAISDLRSAIRTCSTLSERFPTTFEYKLLEAVAARELAFVYVADDNSLRADEEFRNAIDIMSLLVEQVPEQMTLRVQLAQTRQQLAMLLRFDYSDTRDVALQEALMHLNDAARDISEGNSDGETDPLQMHILRGIQMDREQTRRELNQIN